MPREVFEVPKKSSMHARPRGARQSAAALLATVLAPPPARAEDPDKLVLEAKTACVAGDIPRAVRLLAELYAATDDPIWIFNQGRCHQQHGQQRPAINRFREYLRKTAGAAAADVAATRREAEGYIEELERELDRPAP